MIRDVPLGDLLARCPPGQPALVYGERSWTFAQLDAATTLLAGGLQRLGLQKGDRAVVWATNIPEWVLLQFALAKLGVILVTANTALKGEEIGYLLRHSGARALFTMSGCKGVRFPDELAHAGELPELEFRIWLDGTPTPPGFQPLPAPREPRELPAVGVEDVINMQYTSGTTGFPKGVRLTSRNIVNNGYWMGQGLGYGPQDRLCLSVPLFHCFGCVIGVLGAYTHGASLYPVEVFEPLKVLQTVHAHRCTALYGVPTMFLAMLEHPRFREFDLSSLRTGVMAGSLCPESIMRRVIGDMHLREMTIAYGLTEASPVITHTPRHDPVELRTTTVGRVLPELEVRVVEGDLQVRGYSVMESYHNDPAATARVLSPEGWLSTGDQASIDENGYVRITGRIKDIIIRGGENVAPAEVEDVLRHHPDVLDAAVYGVPCAYFGETVAAAVRLKEGGSVDGLNEHCREHLAHFKVPVHWRVVEQFPLTASGKVQKFRLRELHVQSEVGYQVQ